MMKTRQKGNELASATISEHAAPFRVLYVDDDAALAGLVTRKLTHFRYAVISEVDPRAALVEFRGNPSSFDALITDLSMPHMTGFELARVVLSIRPDLPVLVTSGFFGPSDAFTAESIGVRAIIPKRATIEKLGEALDCLFAVKRIVD